MVRLVAPKAVFFFSFCKISFFFLIKVRVLRKELIHCGVESRNKMWLRAGRGMCQTRKVTGSQVKVDCPVCRIDASNAKGRTRLYAR